MLGDAADIDDGATLACDVCIIGAGPAGITVALELAQSQLDVVVLESGGSSPSADTQNLNQGELLGAPQFPPAQSRLRMLGGTTGHWAGMCRPLDSADFEPHSWIPLSGWPISRRDLDPSYARAHELCELGPYDYGAERWPTVLRPEDGLQRLDGELRLIQLSAPTRFGQRYQAALESAARIRVLLHSTVTEVVAVADGRAVERVDVRSLAGRRFAVRARTYVMACGAIENARLLLLSNSVQPAGLGNERGWVGRCFMDHPAAQPLGTFQLLRKEARRLVQAQPRPAGAPRRVMVGLGLGFATRRAAKLLNGVLYVGNPQPIDRAAPSAEERSTLHFLQRVAGGGTEVETASCWLRCEQAPNPASRVTLGDDLDALGQRRMRLDWRLTDLDFDSLTHSARLLVRAVGAANLGRIRLEPWLLEKQPDWWSKIRAGWHHMGTTRMTDDPAQGVVDRDCRVFGVENLFVAGGSVFATSGFANPTLTIVALAVRLAETLRRRA